MSGTSLDGIDIAWIESDGEQQMSVKAAATYAYSGAQRAELIEALKIGARLKTRDERPERLMVIEHNITRWHGDVVESFLRAQNLPPSNVNLIGFHGQTVVHRPEEGLTVQLGDGQALAGITGITVIYDLRAADMMAGGQGAPLVPVYHRALASNLDKPVAIVNIGGVANVTWVGQAGNLLAFDTGPGNALINDWCEAHGRGAFDAQGQLAASGAVDDVRVAEFLRRGFFTHKPPKSLDRNAFSTNLVQGMSLGDGAATLTAMTARSIAGSASHMPEKPQAWIISGGGRHNTTLLHMLRREIAAPVYTAEDKGWNGDALEAEAWAYLAIRSFKALPITYPGTTGVPAPMTGGRRALPS